jgi:hypothetical protein
MASPTNVLGYVAAFSSITTYIHFERSFTNHSSVVLVSSLILSSSQYIARFLPPGPFCTSRTRRRSWQSADIADSTGILRPLLPCRNKFHRSGFALPHILNNQRYLTNIHIETRVSYLCSFSCCFNKKTHTCITREKAPQINNDY